MANTSARRWDVFIPNPKSKLLDQVREVMRFRHDSIRTEEARRLLGAVRPGTIATMVKLLYGTGMRLMECVRLRVKDVDFGRNQIVVRDGKGAKDRVTLLPHAMKRELEEHLKRIKALHDNDIKEGFPSLTVACSSH